MRHVCSLSIVTALLVLAGGAVHPPAARAATAVGGGWERLAHVPSSNVLWAVDFPSKATGWAVGYDGVIRKTTNGGVKWSTQASRTSLPLWSVCFVDNSRGWAAGGSPDDQSGVVIRTTDGGATWSKVTPEGDDYYGYFTSVCFITSQIGWVADWDSVYKTTDGGNTWTRFPVGHNCNAYITFANERTGWMVGSAGLVQKTTDGGATWVRQQSATSSDLYAVEAVSPSVAWAAGAAGTVMRTQNGGATWSRHYPGVSAPLHDIQPVSSSEAWAVGTDANSRNGGVIVRTKDSGSSWTRMQPSLPTALTAVSAKGGLVWATGANLTVLRLAPKPNVGTPSAPRTVRKNKTTVVRGSLKPRHTAGSRPIRVYRWKKTASGKWKSYGFVRAKVKDYSTYSRYSVSLKFPSRGKWRVRAYAPTDAAHRARWSAKYDYITVR